MPTVLAREVFSDNNFNPESRCVRCGNPAGRTEDGKEVAPILAIGILSESGALDEAAATLCSPCVSAIGFQLCYRAAPSRSGKPRALHRIYQVAGPPREQSMIEELVRMPDQSIAP